MYAVFSMSAKFRRSVVYILFIVFSICFQNVLSERKFGILTAESASEKENFCMIYFPNFSVLPAEKSEADFHILGHYMDKDFCYADHLNLKSQVILSSPSDNCSLAMQARAVQDFGGAGILFITFSGNVYDITANSSETEGINITVGFISEESAIKLRKMEGIITACMFSPTESHFDFSLCVIWIIAMFTIYVGGYWSGVVHFTLYSNEVSNLAELRACETKQDDENTESSTNRPVKVTAESSLNVSPYAVAVLVICMVITLLLLYFFYDYLVYFFIGLFVIISIYSICAGLHPLVMKVFPPWFNIMEFPLANKMYNLDYRHILLLAISVTLPILWVIIRKEKYAWVLQDMLGVFFCINMLKVIRLGNLKICSVLLILLFFYDIFFVFITPFLTAKGESIMEKVATGSKSEEKIPMSFVVPYLGFNLLTLCYQRFSSLGFGDVLVPGLLIAYCHLFDLFTNKSRIYFHLVIISYGIGLIVTFISLCLMNMAQPALLYLVPATLLPPIILGFVRGELSLLWNGLKESQTAHTLSANIPSQNIVTADEISNKNLPYSCNAEISTTASDLVNADVPVDSCGEKKHLL